MNYLRNRRNNVLENRDDWKEELEEDLKELNVLMPEQNRSGGGYIF
jgi:hypothetical protein